MSKHKKRSNTKKQTNKEVDKIESKRTGGQVALRGFSYQLIYSCYITLKFINNDSECIRLEGIEDVDLYKSILENDKEINHIQLKHSKGKEDASFFLPIMKNYLEVYLADENYRNRKFTLVYDADIAKGNLSKLINKKLDDNSKKYWLEKIQKIMKETPTWRWDNFKFEEFYNKLEFENFKKEDIISKINELIIKKYEISTGNEIIFMNALFYNIFHMAQERKIITNDILKNLIQDTKDAISKGYINPADKWIDKIDFNMIPDNDSEQYFEGKKATPSDIKKGLPIRRINLEEQIKNSVIENKITVIKSSSGQGKTTLAWQVAYGLKEEYSIYKLNWCNDSKEIQNIIEYFNSRLKLGEKILIIIDNLNEDVQEWNKLSQQLIEKIAINYSILITTREEDWYAFAGDQSNLGKLEIIDIYLDYKQAQEIYLNLKNKIHKSVKNWQSAWEKVEDRRLLIEYVYLLTHGEMIEDRIINQLSNIMKGNNGDIKSDILRTISLADLMGIKIKCNNFISELKTLYQGIDLNEIMISIEKEYFIKLNESIEYIEGLHPVRSKYLFERLHEYYPINDTMVKLLNMVDDLYVSKLYSQIPNYIIDCKDDFYIKLAKVDSAKSYRYMSSAIRGIFSGCVYKYYTENKSIFDDANKHYGLNLFLYEINPWNSEEYGVEVKTLAEMNKTFPDNENIKYLLKLSKNIDKHKIKESDYYIYSYYLFTYIKGEVLKRDKSYFSELAIWFRRIDRKFNIIKDLDLECIWEDKEVWKFEELSKLMYLFNDLEKEKYTSFINKYKEDIFRYLRIQMEINELYERENNIYIKYILLPQDIKSANNESVKRIDKIGKFLPIYDFYCTDAIKPNIDLLNNIKLPDDAHKKMPLRNVILPFNSDLNKLWAKSILSQYELKSIYDWQKYWIDIRKNIIEFFVLNIEILEKKLKQQVIDKNLVTKIDKVASNIHNLLSYEIIFPLEERPFESDCKVYKPTSKIKNKYFPSLKNYLIQYPNIITKNTSSNLYNLAIFNLKASKNELGIMQTNFNEISTQTTKYFSTTKLEIEEEIWLNRLLDLNEYYLENSPSKFFNRDCVRKFNEERKNSLLEKGYEIIDKTKDIYGFDIIKPNKIIYDKYLKIMPIGIRNFDIGNEESSARLIESFMGFGVANVEYILIIIINSENGALYNGIRINTDLFREIKEYSESETGYELNNYILPYEITEEHLACFEGDIQIVNNNINEDKIKDVDLVLLALWEYNKYKEILKNSVINMEEKEHISKKMLSLENRIDNYMESITKMGKFDCIDGLIKLAKDIIDDVVEFNDKELNYYLNKFCYLII